jgi:mannose-6-phosphate isomerase-like protein (cupin superfamily)
MTTQITAMSEPSFVAFVDEACAPGDGTRRWAARGQNFVVELIKATARGRRVTVASEYETILLPLDAEVSLATGNEEINAPARSVCVAPPGVLRITLAEGGRCVVLCSSRADPDAPVPLNAARHQALDSRILPSTPAWIRKTGGRSIDVFLVDQIKAPADSPRLKMFQSSTMSINWAEYEGPRDRRALSPHSHSSFEQGSLALEGEFVHHLRWPWSKDATQWREDAHVKLGSPSLMVVPPDVVHTTEGVGDGHHLLIDVFSPPRRDFIEKNWVANSGNYSTPAQAR